MNTPHILRSSTKAVTGLLAGVLDAQGRLRLSVPVSDYVTEIAGTLYEGVTLHDLLDMRVDVSFDAAQQRGLLDRFGDLWFRVSRAGPSVRTDGQL